MVWGDPSHSIISVNFFWGKGVRFFSCRVPEFSKMIRLLPKISENFGGSSEEFRSSEVSSQCVWDRLKKNNPLGFFPSKSVNLGLKPDLNRLFLSQVGSSLHFSVVNWSFKVTSSHLWIRREKLVCRRDLAWDQSLRLTGVRITPKACELVGTFFWPMKIPCWHPAFESNLEHCLFSEELIFRGAYCWREFCISKWVWLDNKNSLKIILRHYSLKQITLTVHMD